MTAANKTIHPIDDQTWIIEEEGVRIFLVEGAERALLIDTGMNMPDARTIAQSLTEKPMKLLNTHGDIDHISGNFAFEETYMAEAEREHYRMNAKQAGQEQIPIAAVRDGEILDLGQRPLRIIAMPGHTPGSIAILDETRRVLICGDPVQTGNIYMFGPGRDMTAYVKSLERLMTMTEDFDSLWPSHGDCPIGIEILPKLLEGARGILNQTAEGTEMDLFGAPIVRYDIGCAGFLCNRLSE